MIHLHPDEKYLPMRPDTFISQSILLWWHSDECPRHDELRPVSASMLGAGGYEHRDNPRGAGCNHGKRYFRSNEMVRPLDGGSVADREGYSLWFDRNRYPDGLKGEGTTAPVFFDVRDRWIIYWFFFGYSDAISKFNHEGDWEGISVLLGPDNRAQQFVYRQHEGSCSVPTDGNFRPSVFTAKGTHASYPNPGEYRYGPWGVGKDHALHTGRKWDARQRLVALHPADLTQQPPWYGFGGAWGALGTSRTRPVPSARTPPSRPASPGT